MRGFSGASFDGFMAGITVESKDVQQPFAGLFGLLQEGIENISDNLSNPSNV